MVALERDFNERSLTKLKEEIDKVVNGNEAAADETGLERVVELANNGVIHFL